MGYQRVIVDKRNNVGWITINRPDVRNALDALTLQELEHALLSLEGSTDIGVIVITGAGYRSFAAGADIAQLRLKGPADALIPGMSGLYRKIELCSKATIAAVNGFALGGGCELAMACDIRICSSNAKFGLPELNLAIMPGAGGTQRLARIVGKGRALDLILTGDVIDAEHALGIGLVTQVVSADQLWQAVTDKADKILAKGPMAVQMAKLSVHHGFELGMDSALMLEKLGQALLFGSADKNEGAQAFLDKRPAQFKGN